MDDRRPRVTPSLLRDAGSMCPRRLARAHTGADRDGAPFTRARLRDSFLAALAAAHAGGSPPRPDAFVSDAGLHPEERVVLAQAARWYLALFGDEPFTLVEDAYDEPTFSPRRDVEVSGWIDAVGLDEHGLPELRQFELWRRSRPLADDPTATWSVRCALLRLGRWVGDRPVRVRLVDLVRGQLAERTVELARELPELTAQFDAALARLRARADDEHAEPGAPCRTCTFVAGCPAHPRAAGAWSRKDGIVPGVVPLSPTALDRWAHCPRRFRNHLLQIPDGHGPSPVAERGLQIHDLLRRLHERGDPTEPAQVDALLAELGLEHDRELRALIDRHLERCPRGATFLGAERDLARLRARPPLFMATARIDALWEHGGVLDVRDYKTGVPAYDRVGDDPAARLQAWVAAPLAEARGLRLRVRYEHLAAETLDDPEVFEPDTDDLATIEEELVAVASAILDADRTGEFPGVADADLCGVCEFRAICPDSAAPADPEWPTPPS